MCLHMATYWCEYLDAVQLLTSCDVVTCYCDRINLSCNDYFKTLKYLASNYFKGIYELVLCNCRISGRLGRLVMFYCLDIFLNL